MWRSTRLVAGLLGGRNALSAGPAGLNYLQVFSRSMFIQTQSTPNAHSMKFVPGETVMPQKQTIEFSSIRDASTSPLARKLLVINGIKSVFLGSDFITVTKDEPVEWALLRPDIFEAIMDHYSSGEPVVSDELVGENDCNILPEDSDVVAMIKELLQTRVKPAVAEDGGNIIYRGFDETTGVLSLEMQGACSSCASSSVTLKNGVENMLNYYVPEVKEVVEVKSGVEKVSDQVLSSLESKLRDKGYIRD